MSYFSKHPDMLKLLTHEGDGILSTISVEVTGYPFGSVTPYCLDEDFFPNILISSIAQHTKNIMADNKVSLLISERSLSTNKQAIARLTYLGNAVKVDNIEPIKTRYLNYFPNAKDYFKTHDFVFYRIEPVRLRYIGGFGKISWIEKDELNIKNIFNSTEESKIINHMNQDHAHNLSDYSRFYLGHKYSESDSIRMCGLDQFGVDLVINETKHRIDFKSELTQASEARLQFVEMAIEARV